jgi:hypothetical protein
VNRHRPIFTIDEWHAVAVLLSGLEDGTLGYLNIAALKYGFQLLSSLGGMKVRAAAQFIAELSLQRCAEVFDCFCC